MKDYIEVSEKTCCEVHNCICVKEVDGKTYCRGCGDVQPKQEDYNQIGAEGESSHNDNTGTRTWVQRSTYLEGVVAICTVV